MGDLIPPVQRAASTGIPTSQQRKLKSFPFPPLLHTPGRSCEKQRKQERRERQEKDAGLQELKKIAGGERAWQRLLCKSRHQRDSGRLNLSEEAWQAFAQKGVLFFKGGHIAVRSVRTDEEKLDSHSEKFKEKKYREASKPGSNKLPIFRQVAVFQTLHEAVRGVIHTDIRERKTSEKIFKELIDVLKDIDHELMFRGRSLNSARVERLRARYAELVEQASAMDHFFAKRGTAKLAAGFTLWNSKNFPAVSWVMAAAKHRYGARVDSISPIVGKSEARLSLFSKYLFSALKLEKDENKKRLLVANLIAIKNWKRWVALQETKWQLAKCFSDERNEEVQKLKDDVYRIRDELLKFKKKNSIRALYKCRGFFSPEDMRAIMHESEQEKPDFERVFRHISASYWQWKLNAVLIDDKKKPLQDRLLGLGHDFKPAEMQFEESLGIQRALLWLGQVLGPGALNYARSELAREPAGDEHWEALEFFKKKASEKAGYLELISYISQMQAALENFRAEEAAERALRNLAAAQVEAETKA